MLLIVTGSVCSGKHTLTNRVLSQPDTKLISLLSTEPEHFGSYHSQVTDATFDDISDMVVLQSDYGYRSGISRSALVNQLTEVDKVSVVMCSVVEALALSRLAPSLNTASVCVYLHCRQSELIRRLSQKQRLHPMIPIDCYRAICEIYENHNAQYGKLEDQSIYGNGFTSVMPINTGKASDSTYQAMIIEPLLSILESFSVYKNMRKYRRQKQSTLLEVLKYANN